MFERGVPLWCWWIPIVWAISFPWGDLTRAPQWDRVHPAPFTDPADKPQDLVANIALFLPFGYSYARWRQRRTAWLEALALAGTVSVSAEALQLFSTDRYPSATDVTAALAGAFSGAALVRGVWDEKGTG